MPARLGTYLKDIPGLRGESPCWNFIRRFLSLMIVVLYFISLGCSDESIVSVGEKSRYIVYISPDGDDSARGYAADPLATLEGVQRLVKREAGDRDVNVRIFGNRGDYVDQTVIWDYYSPDHGIVFESYPGNTRARFIASEEDPPTEPFFELRAAGGERTNLTLRRLEIVDYVSRAIYFSGFRESPEYGWNGGNVIEDCVISGIGNSRMPERPFVHAAITFVNSRNNVIKDCLIEDCANVLPYESDRMPVMDQAEDALFPEIERLPAILTIIGVYMAHYSSNNRILNTTFENIPGDCVRLRDFSCENTIQGNTFIKAGWSAVCTIWHCSYLSGTCSKSIPECSSWKNLLSGNIVLGNWNCEAVPEIFKDLNPSEESNNCCFIPPEYDTKIILASNSLRGCE